jgi:hypothetical protein
MAVSEQDVRNGGGGAAGTIALRGIEPLFPP